MRGFSDEDSIARLLRSQEESPRGLNTAFLYGEEFLGGDYEQKTLRVNADLMGFDERGRYPGTVYIDEDIDRNVWISFEDESEFPESHTAQSILASEELSGASGEIIEYTIAPKTGAMNDFDDNLDNHERDSSIEGNYNPSWLT